MPVFHVVGAPTTATQAAGRATHHTLGDGDFGHFARMTAEVAAEQAQLTAAGYADEIDRVIVAVRDRKLPGYLVVPADVSEAAAEPARRALPQHAGITDPDVLDRFQETAVGAALIAGGAALILIRRRPALSKIR